MFIQYIENIKSTANNKIIPVLIGHNASVFDTPILLRSLTPGYIHALKELDAHFADSLPLAKQILKEHHPALCMAATAKFCQAALGSQYSTLFYALFPAHDALEDVKALRKVLFQSKSNLTTGKIISESNVMSVNSALAQLHYNESCYVPLQTFSCYLCNPAESKAILTKAMAQKIAASGITYQNLIDLFRQTGKERLVAILSLPPSSTRSKKPRVTRNRRILKDNCSFFTISGQTFNVQAINYLSTNYFCVPFNDF